jgi:hypothetical protein
MKNISFLLITMALWSSPPSWVVENNVGDNLQAVIIKDNFCKEGSLSKTIRSYQGKHCLTRPGALLALLICKDWEKKGLFGEDVFNDSKCNTNIKELKLPRDEILNPGMHVDYIFRRATEKTEICNILKEIYGDSNYKKYFADCQPDLK